MTGSLVANNDSSQSRKERVVSRPRSGRISININININATTTTATSPEATIEFYKTKIWFQQRLSEFHDHQRLLSRYTEGKRKQQRTTNYSENRQQPVDHNATDGTLITAHYLRENRITPNTRLVEGRHKSIDADADTDTDDTGSSVFSETGMQSRKSQSVVGIVPLGSTARPAAGDEPSYFDYYY